MAKRGKLFVIPVVVAVIIGITIAVVQKESSISEPELAMKEFEFTAVHLESGNHETHTTHSFLVAGEQNPTIEAKVGDFVKFKLRNADQITKHDLAVPDLNLRTEIVEPGAHSEVEFAAMMAGEFEYLCNLHPDQMKGLVVISN
ncbi:MAG: cupredoxin domain-containing protein [Nitrososphaerales archaeon]